MHIRTRAVTFLFVLTASHANAQVVCPMECACSQPSPPQIFLLGIRDDFAPSVEVPAPDPVLLNLVTTCSSQANLQYDEVPGENGVPADRWFAETVRGDLFFVCDARIEVHVRATTGSGSSGTSDDRISLQPTGAPCTPNYLWSARLADLPASGGQWLSGQDATFCLDLDDLPASGGVTNILYALSQGALDVVVDDDTGVDSIVVSACIGTEAVQPIQWSAVKNLYRH